MKHPTRYRAMIMKVKKILLRRSWTLKMFVMFEITDEGSSLGLAAG